MQTKLGGLAKLHQDGKLEDEMDVVGVFEPPTKNLSRKSSMRLSRNQSKQQPVLKTDLSNLFSTTPAGLNRLQSKISHIYNTGLANDLLVNFNDI